VDEAGSLNPAAGFRPDTVRGADRLDIRREALTLAMVLAHKDVEPPISVGLFGDWGSGKSFFMGEMRELIEGLSRRSREVGGRFCEDVVQLEFNAWHYMDSDLWASLAREIFEGLATKLADREKPKLNLERERLRAATQSTKDLIAATDVQVADVQRRLDETQRQLNDVEQQRASVVADVARATVTAVLHTPEVEQQLRTVASQLRIDQAGRSAAELKKQIDDLTGLARWMRALAGGLAMRWKGLLVGLLLVAAGAFVLYEVTRVSGSRIAAAMTRFVAIAGPLTLALATVGKSARAVLGRAEAFRQSLEDNLERQKEARTREIEEKQRPLEEARQRLEEQQTRQKRELERLRKLSRELEGLDASRQLVDFIRQRDASGDYRKRLGTVARASQDFKRLSDLMARAALARKRKAEGQSTEEDEEDARLPRIDRIVLYIDDLDRCPEKKVVDVLQAVHLLLAYPLFVVVVGVDPRWLLHSLEEHSGAFRMSLEPGEEEQDRKSAEWRSTSLNYLEKIFQIPYTLRPMDPDGFKRLVDDLSASKTTAGMGATSPPLASPPPPLTPSFVSPAETPSLIAVPSPPAAFAPAAEVKPISSPIIMPQPIAYASPQSQDAAPATPARSPQDVLDEMLLDPNPSALELDERERDFMSRLFELIPTPRAAKRFVNVYRLIRASIATPSELRWFLEDREFVAVQVLLAMVTGAPAEASEILRELLARPAHGAWNVKWWDLVDGVVKRGGDKPGWHWLHARLQSLRDDTEVPRNCKGFRKWADDVARYSFYSGRVLLGPQPSAPERKA
jgi:hypothetical protein